MATTRHSTRTSARTHKVGPRLYLATTFLIAGVLVVPLGTTSAGAAQSAPRRSQSAVTASEGSFPTLAARWWRWDLSQPAASNPLIDPTGTFPCARGQTGPVWFLAGVTPGATVAKTCTISAEKNIFFNIVGFAFAAFPTDRPAEQTVAFVKAQVALANVRNATDLSASVDNKPLPARSIRYEDSRIFSVTVPEGNVFGQPAGTVDFPCAQAGYYASVKSFRPGQHTLHFTGKLPGRNLVDVTYQLTVTKD